MYGLFFFIQGIILSGFFLVISVSPVLLGVKWALRKAVSPHWLWLGGVNPFMGWIAFAVIRLVVRPREAALPQSASDHEIECRNKTLKTATFVIWILSFLYIGAALLIGVATLIYSGDNLPASGGKAGFFAGYFVCPIAAVVYVRRYLRQLRKEYQR